MAKLDEKIEVEDQEEQNTDGIRSLIFAAAREEIQGILDMLKVMTDGFKVRNPLSRFHIIRNGSSEGRPLIYMSQSNCRPLNMDFGAKKPTLEFLEDVSG